MRVNLYGTTGETLAQVLTLRLRERSAGPFAECVVDVQQGQSSHKTRANPRFKVHPENCRRG